MYTILYVDDEPGLLEIGKIFLEQDKEFSVDTSESGQDALAAINNCSYDAIVSDYQMPGMDGIALLKEVRKKHGDIPFILFTGRGREEVVIEAINNGADFYLQKGGDPRAQFAELAHKVRQAVARKRAEYSLVESEKRLTDIINFLPDATFAIDKAGTVIAWNRAIEEMTGVTAAEMVGKGDYEYAIPFYGSRRKILIDLIFEPEDVIARHYANIHREKDVLIADTNLPRPKGEAVWLMGKASPLYDRQGRIVGAIETIRDITQLRTDAEQIARKTSALTIMNRIIQASNLRLSLDDYLTSVLALTIDLLHYHAGGVYLIDKERKEARLVCSKNLDPKSRAAIETIDIHTPPFDTVFIRGEPIIIGNTGDNFPQEPAVPGFYATAGIPVVAENTVIGLLTVASTENGIVDREEREILITIGRELGSAIARIKAEAVVRESESRLRYMLGFYDKAEKSEEDLRMFAVEGAGAVTGSPLGYLAFLNEDESVLTMYAWSKSAMKECSLQEKTLIYPVEKTGLWGEAVRQRRPVITNDYEAENPKKKGYPEGHPRIIRHMNVPVFDGDRIVIVAGVANRPTDYTENEVRELTLLMQGLWHVIKRQRAEKELLAANEQLTASDEEMRSQFDELAESERRLRESEERLATFMNSATDAFTIWDASLNLVDLNRVALSYLPPGTHKEDVIGRNLTVLMPGSRERGEYARYLKVISTGVPFSGTEKLLLPGYGDHWLAIRAFRVGTGLGIVTSDITRQKEAEDELRWAYEQIAISEDELRSRYEELAHAQQKILESQQQLEEITGTIPGVVYQFYARPDGSMGFYFVGGRAPDIFGISDDPVTFFDELTAGIDPDDRKAFLESISTAVSANSPWDFEGRFVRPDGKRIWFQGTSRPVKRDSEIVYNGVLLDITQRKKAEEERRASEERYRNVIEHSPYGMHFYQLVPGRGLVFTGANSGADRILKVSHSQFIGKTIEEAFPGLTGTEIPARYREVIERGSVWETEQVIDHDGAITGVFAITAFRTAPGSMAAMFVDITERKTAEDALFNSRQMLQLVLDTIPQRVFWKDRNSVFLGCNKPLAVDAGFSKPEDMVGKTDYDHASHATADLYRADDRFVMETGQPKINFEEPQIQADGSHAWLRTTKVPLRNKEGAIIGVLGTYEDITEQKRALQKLQESEERYRTLVESSFDGIAIHQDGVLVFVNRTAATLLGYDDPASLIGKPALDVVYPDDRAWIASRMTESAEKPLDLVHERLLRADGGYIHADVATTPCTWQGRPAVYVTFRDISDRVKAEEALRERTEELDEYFTASLDLFCIADTGGFFRRLNPEWERTLGYPPAELEGKRFLDFVHPEDLPGTLEAIADLKDQKVVLNFTNRYRHRDGTYRWIEWRGFPKGDRIFAAARDITGRKRTEEALRESEERYRSIFENSYAVMLLVDPDTGSIVDANPAACAYYGWSRHELTGMNIFEINTLTPDQIRAEMEEARSQKRSHFLFRHRRADNTVRDVEVYSGPLRVKDRLLLHSIIIDVTERRRLEEELRAGEERLRLFIRHAPAALAMFDTEMRYIAASRRWITDYHLGDRDLTGCSHYEIFPEITENIKTVHRRALAGEVISSDEDRFEREDWSVQWLSWEVRPWYTTGNAVGGIIIFSEDITERKRAEEALRESEEKFRSLVEATSDFIWEVDEDGVYTYVSPKVRDLIGYEAKEVIGRTPFDFMPPGDADRVGAEFRYFIEKRLPFSSLENRNIRKDGSTVILETSGVPKYAPDGRFAGYRGIDRDITKRKNAEQEVRRVRDMLKAVVDNSYDAIFISDKDFRILDMNARMLELFRTTRDEALKFTIYDLTGSGSIHSKEEFQGIINEVLSGNDQFIAWQAKRPGDGSVFDAEVYLTRVDLEGVPVLLANVRDITERKQMQDALQEKSQALSERVKELRCLFTVARLIETETSPDTLLPAIANALPAGWQYPELTCARIVFQGREFPSEHFRTGAMKQEAAITVFGKHAGTIEIVFLGDEEQYGKNPFITEEADLLNIVAENISRAIERQQAEHALHESEEKYRTILENLQDAYFRTDENGIVTMVNPSAIRMYGYRSAQEMIGLPATAFYSQVGNREEMLRNLLVAGGVTNFIGEGRRKDGTSVWISLNVQFIRDTSGRILGTEATARDITEWKTMERALKEANRKLALLGSITRHDVANKVSIIKGFAQAAQMMKPSPELARFLDKIDDAGTDIARQIAFTKTYQELGMHEPAWQSICDLVAQQTAEGVAITCSCDAAIFADPMFGKVISNLVDNAVRHGERVTEIDVSCGRREDGLVIVVEDNGVGVPLDLKEKIFERGFGKHTGFGLFLAREILAITGITIRETGEPGKGARFELVVPEGGYRVGNGI